MKYVSTFLEFILAQVLGPLIALLVVIPFIAIGVIIYSLIAILPASLVAFFAGGVLFYVIYRTTRD